MSLRNLLPIGRAFIPAGGNAGRYRPAEPGVMPVFSGPQGVRVRPAVSMGMETFAETSLASAPAEVMPSVPAAVAAAAMPLAGADCGTEEPAGRLPEAVSLSGFPGFQESVDSAGETSLNLFAKRSVETPPGVVAAVDPGLGQGVKREKISVERSLSRPPPAPVAKVTGAGDRDGKRHWRLPVWVEQLLASLVRPGNRRRGTRPVQTEMTFERVKVARNDLMTADVEVVSVGSGAPGRPARLSAACRARLLRLWWGQGSERWKRLGNVFRKS